MAKTDLNPIAKGAVNPFTDTAFINYILKILKAVTEKARVYPKGTAKLVGNEYIIDLTEATNDPDEGPEATPESNIPDGYELITITFCTGSPPVEQTRQVLALIV